MSQQEYLGNTHSTRSLFSMCGKWTLLLIAGLQFSAEAGDVLPAAPSQIQTNVRQLWSLTSQDFLRGCSFHLTGAVTLLDTNRNLLVLQDATGAVAINLDLKTVSVQFGQKVSIDGFNASPYVARFPRYPNHPSDSDIRTSFEAPSNIGDYYLTRMRGYLHPPVTGIYTFWIASDNSSELWLSADEDPAMVKKIAFLSEGLWVNPREWSRYASQKSESVFLRSDRTYYIEAFQEQINQNDHLAVAWQGPGISQQVIDGRYLTPWTDHPEGISPTAADGILREQWTNFTAGTLSGIAGPRTFDSALTAKEIHLAVLGSANLPKPRPVSLHRPLSPENNYVWAEVGGTVNFAAGDGGARILELKDGQQTARLRVATWKDNQPDFGNGRLITAVGVCEGVRSTAGTVVPGLIWVPSNEYLSLSKSVPADTNVDFSLSPPVAAGDTNFGLGGWYGTRGVVTFSGRILDRDCLFIQDENGGGVFIAPGEVSQSGQLPIGQWVETGGNLLLGKNAPGIQPLILRSLGPHAMPDPLIEPFDSPLAKSENGLWAEVEGVARSLGSNGLVTLAGKKSVTSIWISQTPRDLLNQYVDSTLRVRGVISLAIFDSPTLLVPSGDFVEVEEPAPADPFRLPVRPIPDLTGTVAGAHWTHRIKVEGVVTGKGGTDWFIEDSSRGLRVRAINTPVAQVGDRVQVVGFPDKGGFLADAIVRRVGINQPLKPRELQAAQAAANECNSMLVSIKANLLMIRARDTDQLLEMQQDQHMFTALLSTRQGKLPPLEAGSRLELTGVFLPESVASEMSSNHGKSSSGEEWQIRLRSPADVVLLNGPPSWSWKRFAVVSGALLLLVLGTLGWTHLLHRRLERQHAAQLMFSRQVLQGQETERRRIAANLHDSLGQNLLVIKNQARLAMQPGANEGISRSHLSEISEMASQAIEEVRQITYNLRPHQLDRLGLTHAVRAALNRVSDNSSISFASDVDGIDGLLDAEAEIHFYRIVQESLNNIIKHSGATEVAVVVKKHQNSISLSVRDNGRGFEANVVNGPNSDRPGFGLKGIEERTRILRGKLTVESRPGMGASLTVEMPFSPPRP